MKNKHEKNISIGDKVFLITDPEQFERFVTAINIRKDGITYGLSHLNDESYHYDFEISLERDIMKATSQ